MIVNVSHVEDLNLFEDFAALGLILDAHILGHPFVVFHLLFCKSFVEYFLI